MPIGVMDDRSPRVEIHDGRVAVWGKAVDDECGLLLSPASAKTAAIKMLAMVSQLKGENLPAFPVDSMAVDHRILDDGEDVVRIVFEVEKAPLAVYLTLTQLAEATAASASASREIDRVRRPKPDR
jgi:hypothetical protein